MKKKCTVCGATFKESVSKSMFDEKEQTLLQKIRAKKVICDDCRTQMLLLNLI